MDTPLREMMIEGDEDGVRRFAADALKGGTAPAEVLDELGQAVRQVGEMFERAEIFLPELMLAADAMQAGVDVVMPMLESGEGTASKGTIVIGTVKNDVHDIGKNIVASFLRASGFTVHDLGRDVPAEAFVQKVMEVNGDIVAVSTLLTSTMPGVRTVLEGVKSADVPLLRCIVGGGPVTPEWAESIGADGTARDASSAADLCEKLVEMKRLEEGGVRPHD